MVAFVAQHVKNEDVTPSLALKAAYSSTGAAARPARLHQCIKTTWPRTVDPGSVYMSTPLHTQLYHRVWKKSFGALKTSNTWSNCRRYASSAFAYKRLRADEVRLLRITEQRRNEALAFSFETYALGQAPPYTSLSYAWGTELPTKGLCLNGKHVTVRKNLFAALHHLRRNPQFCHIWVDALCINQTDPKERSQQVRIMDHIFSDADLVSAWLGPAPREDGADWSVAECFADVANREYWSRMWVVQELLMAKEIQLFAGQHHFDFEHLKSVVHYSSNGTASNAFCKLQPFLANRDPDRFPQSKLPLYDLLMHFKDSKCGDPRDKVFSLLSLIPEREQLALRSVFPDYVLTVDEVVAMTLAFLKSSCRRRITSRDDDLFTAFNVGSVTERKRLLESSKLFEYCFAQESGATWAYVPSASHFNNLKCRVTSNEKLSALKQDRSIEQFARDFLNPLLRSLETVRRMAKSQKRMAIAVYGACLAGLGVLWYNV